MKLQSMMTNRKPNLYLFPATMLCLHLILAISGFYLSAAYQADLDVKTAEYEEARSRLPLIREARLNADFILDVMSTNVENSRVLVGLFRMLAATGAVVVFLSVASLIQIYKQRGEQN
jgi:hypothetical protein